MQNIYISTRFCYFTNTFSLAYAVSEKVTAGQYRTRPHERREHHAGQQQIAKSRVVRQNRHAGEGPRTDPERHERRLQRIYTVGYPKQTALALAEAIRQGKQCRINIWTGASVGPEIEEALSEVDGIASRAPYYAASNKALRQGVNTGRVHYVDAHLSHFGPQVDFGFLGAVDVAVVEAAAITEQGDLVLGSGVGNTPIFVKHARQIIVEVNTSIPLSLEGMHDIYLCNKPPFRREIPIYHPADRIGSPYVTCGIDRIDAIVESDMVDHVRDLTPPDEDSKKSRPTWSIF